MRENRRIDRINAVMQRELSELIQKNVKDPRVQFCTVSQIEVSRDLKYADVSVSVVGTKKDKRAALAGLKSASGYLRRQIGRNMGIRYAPELRFSLDESADHLMQIDRLIKQVQNEERRIHTRQEEEE